MSGQMNDGEFDNPTKKYTRDNKTCSLWLKDGLLHREGHPAEIILHRGYCIKRWCINGKNHRDNDEPAVVKYWIDNMCIVCEEWWMDGVLSRRDDNPAIIKYSSVTSGKILEKEWWVDGEKHRENDNPAVIMNSEGNVVHQEWWDRGQRHRDGNPAVVSSLCNVKKWYVRGKLHRTNGPAVTNFNNDQQEWWMDGYRHRDYLPAVIDISRNPRNPDEFIYIYKWYNNGVLKKTFTKNCSVLWKCTKRFQYEFYVNDEVIKFMLNEDGTLKWEKVFKKISGCDVLIRRATYIKGVKRKEAWLENGKYVVKSCIYDHSGKKNFELTREGGGVRVK